MEDRIREAKQKALSLLNFMDRTEAGLRQKLKEKSFEGQAIDEAVEYVKSFGYINDVSYAERYILNRQTSKSKREIYAALCQKGICREDIELAMESCYEAEDEFTAILRLCEKKHFVAEEATDVEKKRMYNYLLRKGFQGEDVRKVLNVQ